MAEIAVAMLDVDEGEPRVPGQPGGADEVLDEPGDLVVGQDRRVVLDADEPVEVGCR